MNIKNLYNLYRKINMKHLNNTTYYMIKDPIPQDNYIRCHTCGFKITCELCKKIAMKRNQKD